MLDLLAFDRRRDRLWLVGDLVNRGPDSLGTLRLLYRMRDRVTVVLGNHDLHLLAAAAGVQRMASHKDTLAAVLQAPDRSELLHWLRHCPLLHHDAELGYTMVHAGLPPAWSLSMARRHARELEQLLQGPKCPQFMRQIYGAAPVRWSAKLSGWNRARFLLNCFTRLRYCTAAGSINAKEKGPPGTQSKDLVPWFQIPGRKSRRQTIIFGHWSTLRRTTEHYRRYNVIPLDTGCVWGGSLTVVCLDDGCMYCVPAFRFHRRRSA